MRKLFQIGGALRFPLGFAELSPFGKLVFIGCCLSALVFAINQISAWTVERERASVGPNASATATLLYQATRECAVAGKRKLNDCVSLDGRLPEEAAAAKGAREALAQRDSYYAKCQRFNTTEDCQSLLTRAWYIRDNEQRTRR